MQAVRAFTPLRPAGDPEPGEHLRGALGLTATFARILVARGHHDVAGTRAFLEPRLADLSPPDRMVDREAAADRLAFAAQHRERVVVFGDYDVDGITSAAIVTSLLTALGADVVPVLASRFDGGYGFSARALARVREHAPALVVTCDCGSSDHPRLADLRAAGIDAVVIDHHLVPAEPLPVHAFLNPHRPECGFPFKHLASCGLALSLMAAVRARVGAAIDLRPYLDLVALGTIADVAPLVGDNRALVRAGLLRLGSGARPGVQALAEIASLPAGANVTGEDVSFRLAPRINAPGRLGSPEASLRLLLANDLDSARVLAAGIEKDCQRRREIERAIVDAAIAQVEATGQGDAPAIVVAEQGWHPGVVGIVAARLVDRFGVPAVVIALEGAEGRGSVRGPKGSRLHDALTRSKDALLGFGGHQAAAGVHVAAHGVERLRESFADACAALARAADESDVRATTVGFVDVLDASDDLGAVLLDLERLEPCGEGNPAPSLRVVEAEVVSARSTKGDHLRLQVRHGGRFLEAFAWAPRDGEPALEPPKVGERVDLVGKLRRDHYRGRGAVELRVSAVTRRTSP